MRFSTRTFLLSSAPNILLLLASFYFVQSLTMAALTNEAKASLSRMETSMARSRAKSEAESARLLKIVGENAPLKAAMQLMALEPGDPDARRTLVEALRDICVPLDLGSLSASSVDGSFLAGVIARNGQCSEMDPHASSTPANGLVSVDGAVFSVTSNRLTQGGEDIGILAVGRKFDLAEIETAAALLHEGKAIEWTAPGVSAAEIERAVKTCSESANCQTRLGKTTYLLSKLDAACSGEGWDLVSLQNLDEATGPSAARLRKIFFFAGVGALIAALVGSFLSTRSIAQPLRTIVANLRESEKSGVLGEFRTGPRAVKEIRELAESFNHAARAVRESKEDLQRAYLEFTGSLASALDARDSYTAGHSHRVSEYACAIAAGLGLQAEEIRQIRIGALLHDIGKIGVSDTVLQKPGKLTVEEFAQIQRHPTIGLRILQGVNGFQAYLDIVELHHENWDGTGYPRGLRGEDVPLQARIVHVADAFDAMTSDRPYRRGMDIAEALGILNRFAGTQFDPAIVRAFLNLGMGTNDLASLMESLMRGGAGPDPQPESKALESQTMQLEKI